MEMVNQTPVYNLILCLDLAVVALAAGLIISMIIFTRDGGPPKK